MTPTERLLAALQPLREQLPSDAELEALDPARDPTRRLSVPTSLTFAEARELRAAIDIIRGEIASSPVPVRPSTAPGRMEEDQMMCDEDVIARLDGVIEDQIQRRFAQADATAVTRTELRTFARDVAYAALAAVHKDVRILTATYHETGRDDTA